MRPLLIRSFLPFNLNLYCRSLAHVHHLIELKNGRVEFSFKSSQSQNILAILFIMNAFNANKVINIAKIRKGTGLMLV